MKKKISFSLEDKTLDKLDKILKKTRKFRNRSHAIEESIELLFEEIENEK